MPADGGTTRGLRVLLISDHADPLAEVAAGGRGGQHVYVLNMARGLARSGVLVDVYTRWDSPDTPQIVAAEPNFRVVRIEAGPRAFIHRDEFVGLTDEFAAGIRKIVARDGLRYDVLFTHYWYSGVVGLEIAREHRLPMSHMYHSIGRVRREAAAHGSASGAGDGYYAVREDSERHIATEATAVVATSPMERDDVVGLLGAAPEAVSVIPHGVDVDLFTPHDQRTVRDELGLPVDERLVLYVGRLEPRKGVDTLLEAVRDLGEEPGRPQLHLLGDGRGPSAESDDETTRLRGVAADLGIADRVHFVGPRQQDEVARYLAAADVCAVPSYYEPYGLVPVEAMACGTPVVASRTGGMRFTVEDGVTGHLVEPRSAADLAATLRLVLERGRGAYEQAARERAVRRFSWSTTVHDTARHLARLAGHP